VSFGTTEGIEGQKNSEINKNTGDDYDVSMC